MTAGAHAAALLNASFEQPGGVSIKQELVDGDTFVTGWVVGGAGTYYESDGQDGLTASDGTHWLGFGQNGYHGGSLSQSFATVFGTTYTVNYDVRLQQGDEGGSGFRVAASTGDSVLSGDASLAAWASGPALTFTGTGSNVVLSFVDATAAASGGISNLALDNVRVSVGGIPGSAAPEPAAWALMILGFGGAGAMLRRRRALADAA